MVGENAGKTEISSVKYEIEGTSQETAAEDDVDDFYFEYVNERKEAGKASR